LLNNPQLISLFNQAITNPQLLTQLNALLPQILNKPNANFVEIMQTVLAKPQLLALVQSLATNFNPELVNQIQNLAKQEPFAGLEKPPEPKVEVSIPKIEEKETPKINISEVPVEVKKEAPKAEEKEVPKVEIKIPEQKKSESVLSKPIILLSNAESVTIPDESEIEANSHFIKTWNIKNTGDLPWPEGTKLVCTDSDMQSLKHELPLPGIIEPGDSVMLSVTMVAPAIPGRYNSYWRLCTKENVPFGHRMWAIIHSIKKLEVLPKKPDVITTKPPEVVAKPADLTPKQVQLATDQMAVWQDKLAELNSMGFSNTELNIQLLTKNSGNMVQTVQQLLGE